MSKESESLAGQYNARRYEWTKAHEDHTKAEAAARARELEEAGEEPPDVYYKMSAHAQAGK